MKVVRDRLIFLGLSGSMSRSSSLSKDSSDRSVSSSKVIVFLEDMSAKGGRVLTSDRSKIREDTIFI